MPSDEQIKTDVVDHLTWDSRVDAADISVRVGNGTVTLAGHVRNFEAKSAAEEDARNVRGVRTVDSRLEIAAATGAGVANDAQIADNVRDRLHWNPELSDQDIEVTVRDGRVTLGGSVDRYWQVVQAERDAASVSGVVEVTSKLVVVPTDDLSDEAIADDIADALDRNARVSVDDIDVRVENGRVTISGIVPDPQAEREAFDAVLYTSGVRTIANNLIIAGDETTAGTETELTE